MRVRVLPPEEWDRAKATGAPWMPLIRDEDRSVVAVEDDAGEILACMSVLRTTRFEGVYVKDRNPGAGRALLRGASKLAREKYGDEWAFIDALDPAIEGWAYKLGGARVPGVTCYVPLEEE